MAYYAATLPNIFSIVNSATHQVATVSNGHGNGWTASQWANKWYPGWRAFNYKWYNNCWWVVMRQGNHYRTVCVSSNYSWHWYREGYHW